MSTKGVVDILKRQNDRTLLDLYSDGVKQNICVLNESDPKGLDDP